MGKKVSEMNFKEKAFIVITIALLVYLLQVDIDNAIVFIKELF